MRIPNLKSEFKLHHYRAGELVGIGNLRMVESTLRSGHWAARARASVLRVERPDLLAPGQSGGGTPKGVSSVFTYETIFITVPTLTEDEEKVIVGALSQVVAEGGGSMAVNERMGRRRLAYPIQKFDDGVYTRFLYDSDAAVPKELERRIRISDKVLRYLTVRMEPDWAVFSKEQAIRDAQARVDAEAARALLPPDGVLPPPTNELRDEDANDRDDDRGHGAWSDAPRRPRRDD